MLLLALLASQASTLQAAPKDNSPPTYKKQPANNQTRDKPAHWRDALRMEERETALQAIARKNPGFEQRTRRNDAFKNDRPALLLLEKRPLKKNARGARLVDAYYYDYQRNETIHCIVDAATGEIHLQRTVTDLQLPLTQDEIQHSFDVFLQSPHRRKLANAYEVATGQSLIDISNVKFKAYVFHASANSARLNRGAKKCGRTRCAQLLLYTRENIALNITPVIDLSRSKVLQANTEPGFASEEIPAAEAVSDPSHVHEHDH